VLGGSLNEGQIPTGYQPGYIPIYSLIFKIFKELVLVLWLWFSKFSKDRFLVCDCGSQKLWKSQRIGQRLVMKTLKPKTLNPKTDQRPFHENLHFFEVFEIIRTHNSLLPNFFSKEMKPTIIWYWDIQTTRIDDSLKNKKTHPTLVVTSVMWDESWRV
jgi:hypothetical protein